MLTFECQVALELQDDGGALQSGYLTHRRYVVDHEPVGSTHILGAQQVDAEDL